MSGLDSKMKEIGMRRRTLLSLIAASALVVSGGAVLIDIRSKTRADEITVYKDPNCGCCGEWIKHVLAAGFAVRVHDTPNPGDIKSELGVPADLQSCHTATVNGYVIEGHVPAADIERLLSERPDALGIAVPDMPIGSPGMEQGSRRDPYRVILFRADGERSIFSSH